MVFVLGHSQGGTYAPLIAKDAPTVAGVILLAAGTETLGDALLRQTRYPATLPGNIGTTAEAQLPQVAAELDKVQNQRKGGIVLEEVGSGPADTLRRRGVQVTAQRLAVMRAVSSRPHGTADEIEDLVRADIGAVSRQAVYDALGVLAENNLIRRIQPARSPARYEDRVDDNHHHVVCRTCGRTVDVDCAVGHRPCLKAADDHGFIIDEAEVVYWGSCPACQRAARRRGDGSGGPKDMNRQRT